MEDSNTPAAAPAPDLAPEGIAPVAAPVEAPKPAAPQQDDFAQRFAALSRKQKAIHEKERSIQSQAEKFKQWEEDQQLFDKDPVAFLTKRGKSLDDVLAAAAKQGEAPGPEDRIAKLEDQIKSYEAAIRKQHEEQEAKAKAQQTEKIVAGFKNEIKNTVSADLETFEAINAEGEDGIDQVFMVCDLYYQTHGEIPPIQWAAAQVENELIERARKYTALKKLAQKTEMPQPPEPQTIAPTPERQTTQVPQTLTNKMAPEPQVPTSRKLTPEESLREAAKLIVWKD